MFIKNFLIFRLNFNCKQKMKYLLLSIITLLTVYSVEAQEDWKNKSTNKYVTKTNLNTDFSKEEKNMVIEVFGDKAKELVFDDNEFSKAIKHLLRNRIEIVKIDDPSKQKKTKMISELGLANYYNESLKEDAEFNISNFNPLKYNLDFFSKGTYIYRIDNTNYFIQVSSQYK